MKLAIVFDKNNCYNSGIFQKDFQFLNAKITYERSLILKIIELTDLSNQVKVSR